MKILLLSPHTDDVELGCGGSLFKFIEERNEIFWVVFSIASESIPQYLPKNILKDEFDEVLQYYGIAKDFSKIFNFKVRHLHNHRQELLEELVRLRKEYSPDLVIGPSLNDYHQDHQVVAHEMIRAFKTSASIISYELPWNHVTFNSQLFVRLTEDNVRKKWEALKNYKSQLLQNKQYFSENFIHGMARMRGVQCNSEFAEAFEVIKWMI
jgi:LmbE family N-acetylglucosaminyl deacetylase